MKTTHLKLPIFPLPIFLLPEGVTKIRIFEPRYLKMVSIASKEGGFIILAERGNGSSSNYAWGSWVEIINFDKGSDGILEIDVKCKSLVEINDVETDNDNLFFGDAKPIEHWSQTDTEMNITLIELSKSLEDVFDNNDTLNELYQHKAISTPSWVIARWLELLPINLDIKATFVVEHNFEEAKEFVKSVIFK
jgi:Lon protease-like protein